MLNIIGGRGLRVNMAHGFVYSLVSLVGYRSSIDLGLDLESAPSTCIQIEKRTRWHANNKQITG